MKSFGFKESYQNYVRKVKTEPSPRPITIASSIGGDFEAMGSILFELVRSCGLQASDSVVEVGCGSGRLAVQLSGFLKGEYLGIETDPTALSEAKRLADRPEWRFEPPSGLAIAADSDSVNMVCFIGVFTHLADQESYLYLEEAYRVLKPGGKVIISFLEFGIASHWAVFAQMIERRRASSTADHHDHFVSRDALQAWADALGLLVLNIWGGDQPFVPLSSPVIMPDGRVLKSQGSPGHSVCVMLKPFED